jgi:nucleoside-diphosphate-sugar epimerase
MSVKERLLVTGGAGVIGQAVYRYLHALFDLSSVDRVDAAG